MTILGRRQRAHSHTFSQPCLIGKNLNVAAFLNSADMKDAGITDGSKVIPCPDCVAVPIAARDRWEQEHPGKHLPHEAREDHELENIALARIGLGLSEGVVTVSHKVTVRTVAHKVQKQYRRATLRWRNSARMPLPETAPDSAAGAPAAEETTFYRNPLSTRRAGGLFATHAHADMGSSNINGSSSASSDDDQPHGERPQRTDNSNADSVVVAKPSSVSAGAGAYRSVDI